MRGGGSVAASIRESGIRVTEDVAGRSVCGAVPECVALPASIEEVRTVLFIARSSRLRVVPLGHGTEPGCEPPLGPFVVLGTDRLAGIDAYEPADLTLTALAGTPVSDLVTASAAHGQWLPFDPPRFGERTLGGLVATGASGTLSVAFGAVRDHVLGVTVVTGDGRVLRLGGQVMKNVAGFDLVRAVVGSRGTLGVVVSATVRVFPVPEVDRVSAVRADRVTDLEPLARRVATGRVVPASAVLISRPGGGGASGELRVRVAGAGAAVDVEERLLLGEALESRTLVSGEEADRSVASGHEVVVRASWLPSRLFELMEELRSSLPPGSTLVGDVLTGRVRAGCSGAVDVGALAALRSGLSGSGGSLHLERAPADLARELGRTPSTVADSIESALRASFDPYGTLDRGRLA